MYAKSFVELCTYEGQQGDRETLREFVQTLETIRRRHENAVELMAQGVLELKETHAVDPPTENRIQYFLDRFYMARIGTRMLLNQHSTLFGEEDWATRDRPGMVGMVDEKCKVRNLVVDAHDAAGIICEQFYHVFPELAITEVRIFTIYPAIFPTSVFLLPFLHR